MLENSLNLHKFSHPIAGCSLYSEAQGYYQTFENLGAKLAYHFKDLGIIKLMCSEFFITWFSICGCLKPIVSTLTRLLTYEDMHHKLPNSNHALFKK